MKKMIQKYQSLSFEERTIFNTRFSIGFNLVMAIGKASLTFFNYAFLVSGVINIFVMLAKLECFLGKTRPEKKSFRYRNILTGIFLMIAGIQYSIYMGRWIITDTQPRQYSLIVGIIIAFISFVELGVAIKGCFNAYGRGHYYRNLKLISLSSALTAIALTEIALTSFNIEESLERPNGVFGMIMGLIIFLIGIYIIIAPKISVLDKRHHQFYLTEDSAFTGDEIFLEITQSKIFRNYVYVGIIQSGYIEGWIFKTRSPIRNWNIFVKIFIIILSEILIFVYIIGVVIFELRMVRIDRKLDQIMANKGCIRMENNSNKEMV